MGRALALSVVVAAAVGALPRSAAQPGGKESKVQVDGGLLQQGISLLKKQLPDLNFKLACNLDVRPALHFAPKVGLVNLTLVDKLNIGGPTDDDRRHQAELEGLARAGNECLRQLADGNQKLLAFQAEAEKARRAFEDMRFRYDTDGVMRKPLYAVPPDHLAVVVANFSSGGPEGVEVADEIAYHLRKLGRDAALKLHVLSGEVRGEVIRGQEAAQDVGKHFPPGTSYVVVWGTLSPNTSGRFHPHLTCCVRATADEGKGANYEIDLEPHDLPLPAVDGEARWESHRRLVAVAAAGIPACYAAFKLNREEPPGLDGFFALAATGPKDDGAGAMRQELQNLRRWVDLRAANGPARLRRLSQIDPVHHLPQMVLNTADGGVMTLVTDEKNRPREFKNAKGRYYAYADVTEVTNRQFADFWNAGGRRDADWLHVDPDFSNFDPDTTPGKLAIRHPAIDNARSVFNVSHTGARRYCEWAGKELPTVEEWQAAARPAAGSVYPWGDGPGELDKRCNCLGATRPTGFAVCAAGTFPDDRSAIGCLDMAGNVSEWCDTAADAEASRFRYCGGNHDDGEAQHYQRAWNSHLHLGEKKRWLGFRGVVRLYLKD